MPYCHVPWTSIDISPQGYISPCCKFVHKYPEKRFNINDSTLSEYVQSHTLNQIKNEFNNDTWPEGCVRCKIDEQNGLKSKRQHEEEKWQDQLEDHQNKGFFIASIAFGNSCNLTCITCGPGASSKWYQEHKKLFGESMKPNHFYKENFVDDFYNNSPNVLHMDIPGGEPFLSGVEYQLELLQKYVETGQSKLMSLHYITNGTIFPKPEFFDKWKDFKHIDIQLSIDGIGDRFEYIRYHANWLEVIENIKKYQEYASLLGNMNLEVSTTVSAYNIAYLDELLDWTHSVGLGMPYLGRVHNPPHLRPTVWKSKAKDFILNRLKNSKYDLKSYVSLLSTEDDSAQQFETFRYRLLRHDQYRKLSFKNTFPEMFTFLSE